MATSALSPSGRFLGLGNSKGTGQMKTQTFIAAGLPSTSCGQGTLFISVYKSKVKTVETFN